MAAKDNGNMYSKGAEKIVNQSINYNTDTIKALLVNDTHTFTKSHEFVSDIVANELSGTGYERKTLASKAIELVTGTPDEIRLKAAELEYTDIDAGTIANVIIYKEVTDDTDSPLISQPNSANIDTIGTNITLTFPDDDGTSGTVARLKNPIVTT